MKVHPAAAVFPMMPEEELATLAADIKTNGLVHAIVTATVDDEELLVDGRNRLKACEIAGVKPRFEKLNGADPVAFILSNNIARRHMTKAQRTMAVAMIYPEPLLGGKREKGKSVTEAVTALVHSHTLSQARTVLRLLPSVAERVLVGAKPLSEAFTEAQQLERAQETSDERLERLKEEAPDLLQLVDEERIKPTDAIAALEKRLSDEKQRRELATKEIAEMLNIVATDESPTQWAERVVSSLDLEVWSRYSEEKEFSVALIKRSIASLEAFLNFWRKDRGGHQSKKEHQKVGSKKARKNTG